MADKKQMSSSVPVYGGDDGFLAVQRLEHGTLDQLLETYGARVGGYKIEPGDKATNVTMKIEFPLTDNENNVSMWAWFIAKAAHPSAVKPSTLCKMGESGLVAYVSWPVWNTVKYVESKRRGGSRSDF